MSVAIVHLTVQISLQMAASGVQPQEVFRAHAEQAIKRIPDRCFAIDRRIVRVVALPPWDVLDVAQHRDHMDPLAQTDTHRIRLISRSLQPLGHVERDYAQAILNTVPEGALIPPEFCQYLVNDPSVPAGSPAARTVIDQLDAKTISIDRARRMLGLEPQK